MSQTVKDVQRPFYHQLQAENDAPGLIQEMTRMGRFLGLGESSLLGWYELEGWNPENKTAESVKFKISCTPEERLWVMRQKLEIMQCHSTHKEGDTIYAVIKILPPSG